MQALSASSPAWPKGGWPRSWASARASARSSLRPSDPGDGAGDLRNFKAVGQAGPVVIAFVIDEDLGLVFQPTERGRMDDAVAVALKDRPHGAFRSRPSSRPRLWSGWEAKGQQAAWPRPYQAISRAATQDWM